MTEDEAQRLREKIARDQTRCRCGVLLASCADCRGWLIENSPRIAFAMEWWFIRAIENNEEPGAVWGSNAAEENDLGVYLARRFLA